MIKLKQVTVNKYKSIQKTQTVEIDPAITTIVGMNESGKTSFLEVIAKTNYFNNDKDFKFDRTQDYPRNELIDFESSGEDCEVVKCDYEISAELLKQIEEELGKGVFTAKEFSYSCHYKKDTHTFSGVNANLKKYLELQVEDYTLSDATKAAIVKATSLADISKIAAAEAGDDDLATFKADIKKIIDAAYPNWGNDLSGYVAKKWINPRIPKYWYFDDYYHLKGKININELQNNGGVEE